MNRVLSGIIGGLIGGVVFGIILQAADLIATVGRLVGTEGAGVGWVTLLVITGVLGAVYALTFGRAEQTWGKGIVFGLAHGVIWWVLGVLVIQPAITGAAFGAITTATWLNLVGYLVHGLVAGLAVAATVQRSEAPQPA